MRYRPLAPLAAIVLVLLSSAALAARPLTMNDLLAMTRVSDAQISPDGKHVAYVLAKVDRAKNASTSTIWLVPTSGSEPRQLTGGPKHDSHPRFSPDGKQLLFESDRSGSSQLWVLDLASGGEARQLTSISTGASGGIWSPDGKSVAFASAVYPEFSDKPYAESDAANKKKSDEIAANPVKARTFDKLFYRHWDSWVEDKRQHLFVIPAAGGEPRDVTPGDMDAVPTSSTFSAGDDYTFTPDSRSLAFTAPPSKDEAWSTNHDLYRVAISGGKREKLTTNAAADGFPRYSPDGKWLAYRAQEKPGYEADRWQLMLLAADDSGKPKNITADHDRSIDSFAWLDNNSLVCNSERNGSMPLCKLTTSGELTEIAADGTWSAPSVSTQGQIAATRSSFNAPGEVMLVGNDKNVRALTDVNAKLLADIEMSKAESVTVPGAGGTPMQMWVIKPPGFNAKQKWPLVYLVHGGPQGAWDDGWSFRWNPQLWAAQGYVVALPNPRGSTGFGQKYVDEISGDWGGRCYEDLMAGVAYLEKQPYIDTTRMAAAGASFGGYMMNWFQGHTDKFKTLITHCGVYNFDSMYSTTDELWFDEWEHGGPPWGKRDSYEKHSPHRFAEKFKTPMLIIHNDQDFRVPVAEGYQMFTTLQRLGVPSRMINFPDEGHWVLKPANSEHWHREVFSWLKKYVPPGGR